MARGRQPRCRATPRQAQADAIGRRFSQAVLLGPVRSFYAVGLGWTEANNRLFAVAAGETGSSIRRSRDFARAEASAGKPQGSNNALGNGLGLEKQQQVIRAPAFRIRSRHIESTERVYADHGAGTLPVEIKIAYEKALARL